MICFIPQFEVSVRAQIFNFHVSWAPQCQWRKILKILVSQGVVKGNRSTNPLARVHHHRIMARLA